MEELKHCNQCNRDLPRSAFGPRRQSHDGLRPECRECRNRRQKRDRLENIEERRIYEKNYMRARRAADPTKANAEAAEWRRKNPEKVKAVNKRSYWKNRDKSLAKSAQWFADHPEEKKHLAKRWRDENPEKVKESAKKTRKKHRVKVNQRNRNRRALKAAAPGKHTVDDVAQLFEKQKGKCAHPWCRKSLKGGYHVDHRIALARGGSNDKKNLQLLCPPCNIKKHAKDPIDFARQNGMLL